MECFRMHYILLSVLIIAVKVSDANIQFQGIEPEIVLVGYNVTFHWRYNGSIEPKATWFQVLDGSNSEILLYFGFGYSTVIPQYYPGKVERYSEFVNWTGNVSRNEFAFTLTEVKEFSHGKNFSIRISYGNGRTEDQVGTMLFISVRPNVTLLIENTNVTVNDLVTIECRIVEKGRPEAKISWHHNNKVLPDKNDRYLFKQREVELKDSGSYKCVAENDAGISESKVKSLIVNKKPGEVEKGPPSSGKSSGGLEAGAIAGIVIAILVVIVVVIIAVIMLKKKKKGTSTTNKAAGNDETKSPMVSNPPERDQVWL